MIGFVYCWKNKLNGKKYIGLHVGKEEDSYIGSGKYFKRAIEKYGIENFERTILYREYDSVDNLYKKEFEFINEMNAVFSNEYYNLTNYDPKIKNITQGNGKRIQSEETKEKIRQSRLGSKASVETKKKMSETRSGKSTSLKGRKGHTAGEQNGQFGKRWYNNGLESKTFKPGTQPKNWIEGRILEIRGNNNPFYGKKHTTETKEKIRKTREKNGNLKVGKDNPSSVRIEVDGIVYDTIKDAMEKTGFSYKKINKEGKRL